MCLRCKRAIIIATTATSNCMPSCVAYQLHYTIDRYGANMHRQWGNWWDDCAAGWADWEASDAEDYMQPLFEHVGWLQFSLRYASDEDTSKAIITNVNPTIVTYCHIKLFQKWTNPETICSGPECHISTSNLLRTSGCSQLLNIVNYTPRCPWSCA